MSTAIFHDYVKKFDEKKKDKTEVLSLGNTFRNFRIKVLRST